MNGKVIVSLLIIAMLLVVQTARTQTGSDGYIYDIGKTMDAPSENAPDNLAKMLYTLGYWKVKVTTPGRDGMTTYKGTSRITLFNHGHGYMEHFDGELPGNAGIVRSTASLMVYNPGKETWEYGEADSLRLTIRKLSGNLKDGSLVLYDATRFMGGADLAILRMTFTKSEAGFQRVLEVSPYGKDSWSLIEKREYSLLPEEQLPEEDTGFGSPAMTNFEASREFDFLIGEFNVKHWYYNGPDKPGIEVTGPATAVFIMNGYAIMEHLWFAEDQAESEREITVIRMYNPATRRWECLFTSNRGNSLLYFGGARKGSEIILNNFESNALAPLSYYRFYDIADGKYRWKAVNSQDRGKTWQDGWRIEILEERK